ncbi:MULTISPECIES: MBL fold metallo-hydrolase [unclassified Psychrobacter]|uniref:MBL fold metallo-hydrolase n=1 Tax=unclassified Psychrobacter TaxID=196806 RepID=UPI00071E75B8|nr:MULTISPECIES: MBL fold metallo-hydrolase [unclassified Psychrobacter]OLF37132.1 MBL fold metallo-hydrolase [Psychrobacter sp. Cmf 22.2]
MLLEKIKTPGLSHLSYLVGSDGKAAVIDPRRDCDIYVEKARAAGLKITHIFETHRNEDLVSGAPTLAKLTGATVLHGPNPEKPNTYAQTTHENDCFAIGQLEIRVLETPGHTDDHISFALFDTAYPEKAVGVFTGDALFVGDVGRTDFYPNRRKEVAGLLYDSLQKILALGDQAIIYPAHGAGSVCGSGMAAREFSSIGHERLNNPRLQIESRDEFIDVKINENHYQPPYFRLMERLNMEGGDAAPRVMRPRNLSLDELKTCNADHLIDIREPMAYAAGHLPGAMSLPVGMISAFAGWFISEEESIVLIASNEEQLATAMEHLVRIALDNVVGGYVGVIPAAAGGEKMQSTPMIDTAEVEERLNANKDDWTLLDVRDADERADAAIEQSQHIYVGQLNEEWRKLDKDQHYTLMCASGARATVAAGWLASQGFKNLDIYLGSMGAWQQAHN